MKEKILFVHYHNLKDSTGGSKRALQNYIGCSSIGICDIYQTKKPVGKVRSLLDYYFHLRLYINGRDCREIVKKIRNGKYDTVFFDTSLFGDAVKYVKRRFPEVRVIVHYHNFEKQYFGDKAIVSGLQSKAISDRVSACETVATKYSDFRVFISEEDRLAVSREYGCSLEDSAVVPVALADQYCSKTTLPPDKPYVLFLGFSFFANDKAAEMLIYRIAPKINKKIVIVGNGMDERFPGNYPNVEIHGFAASLDEIMGKACAFVSPVFFGSGAKIKIADALMRGKYIIASRLSLCGYDMKSMKTTVCDTVEDFISAINSADGNKLFYPENRALFLSSHDINTVCEKYAFLRRKTEVAK